MGKYCYWVVLIVMANIAQATEKRPNIVWLISEDNSKNYLSLYHSSGANMPNIEGLAEQGIVYLNAYSNSPVCSTARSTLATGHYAPALNMQNHRTFVKTPLTKAQKPLSKLLSDHGYYTTNKAKEDYNFIVSSPWNVSAKSAHWRNRKPTQAFFHVQSFGTTHESSLHFTYNKPDADLPSNMTFPYQNLANTKLMENTVLRYKKQHERLDSQIGKIIKELQESNVLDDTFVFYFGDHGGVLPFSKGFLYETGLSIPMVLHIPKNFRHLVHKDHLKQRDSKQLVSLVDMAPTVLALAGIPAPKAYDGHDFLTVARDVDSEAVFGYADRFDEKYDIVRSVRIGDYKYIRYYQPYYTDSLYNNYRYKQAAYGQMKQLYREGRLSPRLHKFFQTRPAEALYNLSQDPQEQQNIATQADQQKTLKQLRDTLQQQLHRSHDMGLLPESYLIQQLSDKYSVQQLQQHAEIMAQLRELADLQLGTYDAAKPHILKALASANQWHRVWGLIVLNSFTQQLSAQLWQNVQNMMDKDTSLYVKSRAYELLVNGNKIASAQPLLEFYQQSQQPAQQLEFLNIATHAYEQKGIVFTPPKDWQKNIPGVAENVELKTIIHWLKARWRYLTATPS